MWIGLVVAVLWSMFASIGLAGPLPGTALEKTVAGIPPTPPFMMTIGETDNPGNAKVNDKNTPCVLSSSLPSPGATGQVLTCELGQFSDGRGNSFNRQVYSGDVIFLEFKPDSKDTSDWLRFPEETNIGTAAAPVWVTHHVQIFSDPDSTDEQSDKDKNPEKADRAFPTQKLSNVGMCKDDATGEAIACHERNDRKTMWEPGDGTVYTIDSDAPEPGTLSLFAGGLAAILLAWNLSKTRT